MESNKLPFGTQFSPNKVKLCKILDLINANNGSNDSNPLITAIADSFYATVAKNSKRNMANNCKASLVAYGILNDGGGVNITDLGKKLLATTNRTQLYDTFARHILQDLNGLTLIDCIRELNRAGEDVSSESLIKVLSARGFDYANTSNNAQVMKLWLEEAGVLTGWHINEKKLADLIDISENELLLIKTLSKEQYFFIKAFCDFGSDDFQQAVTILKLAKASYGIDYKEKTFNNNVLKPLEKKGLIEMRKVTAGRGAKSPDIKLTDLSKKEIIAPFLKQIESIVGNEVLQYLQKTITEIRDDIDSTDTYVKGLALEAFAIKIMRIIGLDFVKTRLKGNTTGGAEGDVVFDSSRLLYSRWQVQCKNTKIVSVDQVAKEVGLSHVLQTNAIVIMTTGKVSKTARKYANEVMRTMNICIIFIESSDIDAIIADPIAIIDIFNREALAAKQIKILDDSGFLSETDACTPTP
jgi:site-specific DNA-methyltransferase (cytosine-N4-specific)